MAILCSDKTGTLTKREMEIQIHTSVISEGAKWHEPARDALDELVLGFDKTLMVWI